MKREKPLRIVDDRLKPLPQCRRFVQGLTPRKTYDSLPWPSKRCARHWDQCPVPALGGTVPRILISVGLTIRRVTSYSREVQLRLSLILRTGTTPCDRVGFRDSR